MELSIIIVSWNVADLLENCLQSIAAYPPDNDYEIWVVDNASQDDTVRILQTRYPNVRVIVNTTNLGFAAANNQALEAAAGRYLLLLNPDTRVFAGTLQTLIDFLDEHPQAGAAGSLYESGDGQLQPSCFPYPTCSREFWRLLHLDKLYAYGVYAIQSWSKVEPHQVETLQGASLMLRRAALEDTGHLDPDYFMYSEEIDLCYRLHLHHWELYWVPRSRIIHYGGQSTRQTALQMFLHLYASKILFFRKHYGEASARSYKRILKFAAVVRLILTSIGTLVFPRKRAYFQQLYANYAALIAALSAL